MCQQVVRDNIQQISYIPHAEHFGLMLFHLQMGNVTITCCIVLNFRGSKFSRIVSFEDFVEII